MTCSWYPQSQCRVPIEHLNIHWLWSLSTCNQSLRQRPCWSEVVGRGSRRAGADIDGRSEVQGTWPATAAIATLSHPLPRSGWHPLGSFPDWESLSTVETICCPPLSASGAGQLHASRPYPGFLLVDLGPICCHCRFHAWNGGALVTTLLSLCFWVDLCEAHGCGHVVLQSS